MRWSWVVLLRWDEAGVDEALYLVEAFLFGASDLAAAFPLSDSATRETEGIGKARLGDAKGSAKFAYLVRCPVHTESIANTQVCTVGG